MSFVLRLMLKRLGLVATHEVRIRRNIKVRMPDGVELLTDLYLGSDDIRAPAIVVRSPYGKGAFISGNTAYPLASQGFNVVLQCCRGTGGSSGTFDPHHDEQRDGLATIEWAKQQPWCNGVIGTQGGSYLGYTQWAVAGAAGPEVKAMAMQITLSDFSRMTYAGDSFMLQNAMSWTQTMTLARQRFGMAKMLFARMRGKPTISAEQWRTLPLGNMDEATTSERVPFWRDWLAHSSSNDPWWSPMNHRKSVDEIKRPIAMVAGWFDIFTPWQLQDFIALQKAGCVTQITIGPWQHTDTGVVSVGIKETVEWFNKYLLGKDVTLRAKPVRLYVINADEWREFDAWPPRESVDAKWYLQPDRKLLDRAAPDSPPDQYRYDPANPTPSIGGPALMEAAPYSVDNASLEARSDVLTYTSEPMAASRDIIGVVAADLYVSSDAASADFFVRLCDVDASGVSRNICDGLQRIKIAGKGPQQVRVKLWPTAYRIAKGHRIRVQVSSGAFPRWARNLGGNESLADGMQMRAAIQAIHHSAEHPSMVMVPFCGGLA